jgi:putative FmdB family regulatory protein
MRYEYLCKDCGTKFELVVSLSSLATTKLSCPNCHNFNIQKVFSVPGISFKGKGFYQTDNSNRKLDAD